MAKKKNKNLRSVRDSRNRKKMSDGKLWVDRLLNPEEEEEEEQPRKKRKKGKKDGAKRLSSDHQ